MNRRLFVALALGILPSGCLGDDETQKRIAWIRLVNNRPDLSTIEVVLENDGEEMFTEEYQLGSPPGLSTVRIDPSLERQGRYTLRFRTDGQWVHIYPEDYEDVSEDCIGVHFELHRQGTMGYEIQPQSEC